MRTKTQFEKQAAEIERVINAARRVVTARGAGCYTATAVLSDALQAYDRHERLRSRQTNCMCNWCMKQRGAAPPFGVSRPSVGGAST